MCVIMKKLRFTEFNDLQIQIGKQTTYRKNKQCCAEHERVLFENKNE